MNAVDLGLSVLWADCNVGASKPEESGSYFAWGEILPKNIYDWNTYKWYNTYYTILTKYCASNQYGKVDNKIQLESKNDAAYIKCGNIWRIPTIKEWIELKDNCTWTWTSDYNGTGVAGRIVTSNINGNSIFLPAAGFRYNDDLYDAGTYGLYWSSSLNTGNPGSALSVGFYSDGVYRSGSDRYCGFSVRPVLK